MSHPPSFGELLRDARRAAGLTQEMLATRAGLSARVISDLERDVGHKPRPGTVQLLVNALSLSTQERQLFEAAARADGDHAAQGLVDPVTLSANPAGQSASAAAPASPGVPAVVGRAREQALVAGHLEGEGPPLLVLAGEPGIGKTRLLQDAATQASARGMHVLYGSPPGVGQHSERDPVIDALRREIHGRSPVQLRRELQGCAWLVRALPDLALGPIEPLPAAAVPPEQEAALIARAVMRFLNNVACSTGTLLALDNLQHADAPALEFLAKLLESAADAQVRIIGAYRDSESVRGDALSALLARLAHEQLVRHVALSALATPDAAELLTLLLGDGRRIGTECREQVLREAGGVPFYLVAWAHELQSHGANASGRDGEVPWAIQQSVRARIDAASPAVRSVLDAMAMVGGQATYALLMALAARPGEHIVAAIEAACRERLIQEEGQTYRFAYDVIRRVVEADLSHARRLVLSDRLAILERNTDSGPRGAAPRKLRDPGVRQTSVLDERAYHLAVLRRHQPGPTTLDRRPDRH
jgi:transcriptional regulator with XRE-family HTH domain